MKNPAFNFGDLFQKQKLFIQCRYLLCKLEKKLLRIQLIFESNEQSYQHH